jgi:hypothetical protein
MKGEYQVKTIAIIASVLMLTMTMAAKSEDTTLPYPCAPQDSYVAKAFKALSKSDAINIGKNLGLSEKVVAALRGEGCIADGLPNGGPKIAAGDPSDVTVGRPTDISQDIFERVRRMCTAKWNDDFHMRAYCEGDQFESVRKLRGGR